VRLAAGADQASGVGDVDHGDDRPLGLCQPADAGSVET
jgi:hypothetical protein